MTYFIGIDPGCKGGIAVLSSRGLEWTDLLSLAKATDRDIAEFLWNYRDDSLAVLEKLSPAPPFKSKQPRAEGEEGGFGRGSIASFKVGDSFGCLRGILTATRIPYVVKTPQVWQRSMSCLSKGDKKVPYAEAQRLFPKIRVTLWNADALLIASYGKLNAGSLFPQAAQEAEATR